MAVMVGNLYLPVTGIKVDALDASSMIVCLSRSSPQYGNLFRAPFGRPRGLPDCPGLNWWTFGGLP